ncbi:MAG: hypothetical protein LLG00_01135 [Planctomycetaceae bacterium]|nr:hypothetical protein [Planctomycetaceae bacterium]
MLFHSQIGLRCALAGCLSVAALAGCQFHRTGHGFVLRSQWSLECDPVPRLSVGAAKNADARVADKAAGQAGEKKVAAKPEVLPWRSRLKARITGKLFGRNASAVGAAQSRAISPPDSEWVTARSSLPPPPKEPDDGAQSPAVRRCAGHEPLSGVPIAPERSSAGK